MNKLLALSTVVLAVGFAHGAHADCGTVTVANMNWQSGELLAHVDKFILEQGFGCQVEFVPGDTVPTITSMVEKGQPDIAGESWVDLVPEIVKRGVDERRIVNIGPALSDGGIQGWYIPKFIVDAHPDIRTVDDAFARPELFPAPENAARGAVFNGPQGSGGSVVSAQLFKAYGGEAKGFDLVDPGTQAGLDGAMAKAYERKEGWMGYYWSPTALLGKYEMVRLDAGVAHDAAEWKRCNTVADCPDPKKNEWPKDNVVTLVSQRLVDSGNAGVIDYLRKRSWDNQTVSAVMSWMTDTQASGEDGAAHFFKEHPDLWKSWLGADVADKIAAAL
ncbi:ABC transporter substrate-binding protein [Shinella yambaruensis]|uniref:ABC transporter substrate-binding protein n=1 Tax=Shinella yambaruensis TaxID=415996 RepID=A0ABQ5ZHB0_9HYPH|nr:MULTISPECIES: ABC transporter substrate-binding protein [Shinella]MCJ8029887.1 ABC transporter substrate-binding protein [Shinella yambaruensis]MCU7984141.1 ABC transporter substrate-binding protein [Shinella yambaruensis]MCW5711602.1 ABC transporter substrate-binding protein [Shinella sp.]GLR52043.1 ABC transporter substrate-binding protein [Shinella yambaruensis]